MCAVPQACLLGVRMKKCIRCMFPLMVVILKIPHFVHQLLRVAQIKKLSIKNGDLHVPLIHMSNTSMGLSTSDFHGASSVTACHAASSPPFILIPRCYCTMFANLGNALCDAFDSLLWAIPTSTTRGKSKRVIHHSVDSTFV